MQEKISRVEKEAREDLSLIDSQEKAEAFRIAYLGKKGKLTELFKQLGAVAPEVGRGAGDCRLRRRRLGPSLFARGVTRRRRLA